MMKLFDRFFKRPSKDFSVGDNATQREDMVYYSMGGKKRRAHGTWYRGETTNFHPVKESLAEPDAVTKYVGHGWFPAAPFVTKTHRITAFGSCFAAEVTKFLKTEGYNVLGAKLGLDAFVVRCGEGIVNSAAILQQFEWAYNDKSPETQVWHAKSGEAMEASDNIKDDTRRIFNETDIFIFTLGLSEVWFDKQTNDIFWRAVPKLEFDPNRHGFRVIGAEENRDNLSRVYQLIRKHRPDAHIVFTLSPVPLAATFRPVSCITANSVSKASLRVAIDELMREFSADPQLHYFPSYEIATAYLEDAFGDDLRHPRPETVDFIMKTFKASYLV
ncbi:GSCFA domain-containing protein [Rhizobium wenxiniae]|uniref:GSCFA domain-containing protein n=1 Tax=Rhizobium wenxiniae TaxID=1737357 RepID=UPI001C6E60B5|nr:GSCFA domain-containing protein [Rhizobium wenxiniae]MBW9087894.1 GSCFA domain-containing protein [Rhizobium wenxiniae]